MSRKKGLDLVREQNKLKKEYMGSLRKYAEDLEAENYALKNDPNTVIGQFVGQYRELYSQNQRLSVLAAALIKKLGESVVLTKDEMEAFQQKLINIKWEIPDGETTETAKEFTFSYETKDAPQGGQAVQATEDPASIPECTDPDCTLPKDLKHTHDAPAPVVEAVEPEGHLEAQIVAEEVPCNDPECGIEGEHSHTAFPVNR